MKKFQLQIEVDENISRIKLVEIFTVARWWLSWRLGLISRYSSAFLSWWGEGEVLAREGWRQGMVRTTITRISSRHSTDTQIITIFGNEAGIITML